jgi:hypothetical protein
MDKPPCRRENARGSRFGGTRGLPQMPNRRENVDIPREFPEGKAMPACFWDSGSPRTGLPDSPSSSSSHDSHNGESQPFCHLITLRFRNGPG